MSKFQRRYRIEVQGQSGKKYIIQDPITLVFDVNRRALGSGNTGHFLLYNLSDAVRNDLKHDIVFDAAVERKFTFQAGYVSEGYMPMLYRGTVQSAFSYKDGPDVVTEFEILDGGQAILNAQLELTRNYPWDPQTEIVNLISLMNPHGVRLGAIGSLFRGYSPTRGVTWIGSVWDILKKEAVARGGYACIDKEKVYLLAKNDLLLVPGALPKLDSSTGLIGTPRRTGWTVDAQMIFEPRLELLQKLVVESKVNPSINGTFSIQSIGHRGIISAAKDGGVVTALGLNGNQEEWNMVVPQ